ncbi:MAG: gamma-glutamylcyclotransferase family protein [Candidatus Hodarchaeota archaeon]
MNNAVKISKKRREKKKENDCDQLFVYGTLQSGQSRNYYLKGLSFEIAQLNGYRKISPPSLGFPFIIQEETSEVRGEIYFGLKQHHWTTLDKIEGEGSLYHRILVEVVLISNNEHLLSYVYYPSRVLLENYAK